ncbi:MAG: response regulator transcription factor [Archangiaceae bacterium]|nr:response regulator transcription factor [Archangiaceae bacterium]
MKPSKTALVVDDDPEIRKLISKYLARLGFAVTMSGDGKSAIKALDAARPTLLCVDNMLPEKSGYDICEYVGKSPTLKGLPILMISARAMPGDRAAAEELGVAEYLVKPFTQAEFDAHVERAMQAKSA